MNNDSDHQHAPQSDDDTPAGVPLGGIGAGSIDMGRDGQFRNLTINNNRSTDTRIDVAGNSFLALRAAQKGRISARILQTNTTLPFDEAGIVPPYTSQEHISWNGLYPAAQYRLNDSKFPLEVSWNVTAPIIPYDLDASSLPLLLFAIHVRNPTDSPFDMAVAFNWENLCGCTKDYFPRRRGPIKTLSTQHRREYFGELDDYEDPDQPRPLGLHFGFVDDVRTNAEGNYCVMAVEQAHLEISLMTWDENKPDELEAFWHAFHDKGRLPNALSRSEESHCGAVCSSYTLEPTKSRTVVFVLSWYCPRYEVKGRFLGNGYTNKHRNAISVAVHGLRHYRYFFRSVEDWQKRFTSSSLPRWYSKMLINSNYVFSSNTLYTADGEFTMIETLEDPITGSLDRAFYSSLATILFFPTLATRELSMFAEAVDKENEGKIYRTFGRGTIREPAHEDNGIERLDVGIKFVLLAYRNYAMTGNIVALRALYPRVKEVMGYVLLHDTNHDGLPEHNGASTMYPNWAIYGANSYVSSLWIAALRAFTRIALALEDHREVNKYRLVLAKAVESFDKRLWNEEEKYYRLYHDDTQGEHDHETLHEGCHTGQLAGQWYTLFLCLGRIVSSEKTSDALSAMCRLNEKDEGVAIAHMPDGTPCRNPPSLPQDPRTYNAWPAIDAAHYSSLHIYQGKVDRGLYTVQKTYKNIHLQSSLTFNQPLEWDLKKNEPTGWGIERHMSAPAIWHTFFALQGFFLEIPQEALWIRPNLPLGVESLDAPLLTPTCLGRLVFTESKKGRYEQKISVSFDSPIVIKSIFLRVPGGIPDVEILCLVDETYVDATYALEKDGKATLVIVHLKRSIRITDSFTLTVTARQPVAAKKED